MLFSSIPAKFTIPWGNGAGGGFIRTIPTPSQIAVTPGAASLTDGFPPLNFQPVGSGGVPPFGQDMNGILKQITQWNQWQGAGGTPQYDSTFSTAVGGYPQGAILSSIQAGFLWYNTVDNNTTNPDNPSLSVGWIPIITHNPSPTIYVRTDGNDNNTGATNSPSGALLTIAAAVNKISFSYYLGGTSVTIQLGIAGTYAAPGAIIAGATNIILRGDPAAQSSYIISGVGPAAGGSGVIAVNSSTSLSIIGCTIQNTGTTNNSIASTTGGSISIQNVTLSTTTGSNFADIFASLSGSIFISTGCLHNGNHGYMWFAQSGTIQMAANVAIGGSPAYSIDTVAATTNGSITVSAAGSTFTGTFAAVTGTRYSAALNGVINTGGGGANFFPGSVAGSTTTGGQYA